jgi:hypothetical protein
MTESFFSASSAVFLVAIVPNRLQPNQLEWTNIWQNIFFKLYRHP